MVYWFPLLELCFYLILWVLLSWKIIKFPHEELVIPTDNINTIIALVLFTSVTYFYTGLNKKEFGY
jgi:F0F1-type ATP synthase membrane subunit a